MKNSEFAIDPDRAKAAHEEYLSRGGADNFDAFYLHSDALAIPDLKARPPKAAKSKSRRSTHHRHQD